MYHLYHNCFKKWNNQKKKKRKRKFLMPDPHPWIFLFIWSCIVEHLWTRSHFWNLPVLFFSIFLLYNWRSPSLQSYPWFLRRAGVRLRYPLPYLEEQRFMSSGSTCAPHISSAGPLSGIFTPGSRLAAVHLSGMVLVVVSEEEGAGTANTLQVITLSQR